MEFFYDVGWKNVVFLENRTSFLNLNFMFYSCLFEFFYFHSFSQSGRPQKLKKNYYTMNL